MSIFKAIHDVEQLTMYLSHFPDPDIKILNRARYHDLTRAFLKIESETALTHLQELCYFAIDIKDPMMFPLYLMLTDINEKEKGIPNADVVDMEAYVSQDKLFDLVEKHQIELAKAREVYNTDNKLVMLLEGTPHAFAVLVEDIEMVSPVFDTGMASHFNIMFKHGIQRIEMPDELLHQARQELLTAWFAYHKLPLATKEEESL